MARRCERVLALDASAQALAAGENAALNGIANVEAREANVFDELRELEVSGARFDTIVLDPPAFAKNRAAVPRAVAGYKEINLRALKLLAPGGHLVTCSCSYNVGEARSWTSSPKRPRRACDGGARREAHAGARPSGAAERARDLLSQVPRAQAARVMRGAPRGWTSRVL